MAKKDDRNENKGEGKGGQTGEREVSVLSLPLFLRGIRRGRGRGETLPNKHPFWGGKSVRVNSVDKTGQKEWRKEKKEKEEREEGKEKVAQRRRKRVKRPVSS